MKHLAAIIIALTLFIAPACENKKDKSPASDNKAEKEKSTEPDESGNTPDDTAAAKSADQAGPGDEAKTAAAGGDEANDEANDEGDEAKDDEGDDEEEPEEESDDGADDKDDGEGGW